MATANTLGTAHWGIAGSATGITGIITSINEGCEALLAPEYNELGAVVKQTKYDEHMTFSFTVEVAKGTSLPKVGDQITVNSKPCYITRAELAEENQSYRKISITAESYKHCKKVIEAS